MIHFVRLIQVKFLCSVIPKLHTINIIFYYIVWNLYGLVICLIVYKYLQSFQFWLQTNSFIYLLSSSSSFTISMSLSLSLTLSPFLSISFFLSIYLFLSHSNTLLLSLSSNSGCLIINIAKYLFNDNRHVSYVCIFTAVFYRKE